MTDPTPTRRDDTWSGGPLDQAGRDRAMTAPLDGLSKYTVGDVLGAGGMGEIVLARDRRLERYVAIKRLRGAGHHPIQIERFLREAKIQALLDHPAIPPVHELGFDASGAPYFTMKRLAGDTLAAVLERDEASPKRLLRALVDVCNALELAHARGVVHRDLKPSNIMLGGYGTVYVIDWGVARILDADPITPLDDAFAATDVGRLVGTPGYMAPEQVRREEAAQPADVYALGAILFEVLSGERLHPRGPAALASTLDPEDISPARRRPERAIAPELDWLCMATLALDPAARPSMHDVAERLQKYLDGDRDVESRRELARKLAGRARIYADSNRGEAMRVAGRALALDPTCDEAVGVLGRLLLEPPRDLPPALRADLDRADAEDSRRRSRRALAPLAMMFSVFGLVPFLEVASWPLLGGVAGAILAVVAMTYINWRVRPVPVWMFATVHLAATVMFSRLASPLVVTPCLVIGILLSLTGAPWLRARGWAIAAWTLAAALLPLGLEWAGVFARTWSATPAGLVTAGTVFASGTAATLIAVGANVLALLLVALYALSNTRDRYLARRQLSIQAWHLRQLLPPSPPTT